MKQILIGKDTVAYSRKVGGGTISGYNELNLLDTGALAIFTEDGVLVTTSNMGTVLDDVKKVYVAVGNQLSDARSHISSLIPRVGSSYKRQPYVAPVKQRKFIGADSSATSGTALNLPTLVAGQEAFVKITDTTPGLRTMGAVDKQEIFRHSVVVKSGDTTTTILTRMAADINANPNKVVTAAVNSGNDGLQIDADAYGTTFDIALDGIFINATMVEKGATIEGVSVGINYGKGTYDQIVAIEDSYSVERGNTNKLYLPALYYSNASLATAGSTYDTYTISFDGDHSMPLGRQSTYHFDILVALIVASTQQAAFETIMSEVFAGAVSTSPVEMGS